MSGAITAAVIGAGAAYYGSQQQKKAAEKAAKGSQVQPWGPTGGYMEDLLGGAMDAWNTGQFQFGPDPGVYNSYLDWGGNTLGLDLGGIQPIDPEAQGYGPEAYAWMLDLVQGPAWRGASQTNPNALLGVQDPWLAGLMGGVGGYFGAGGGGGGQQSIDLATTGYGPQGVNTMPTQQVAIPAGYDWQANIGAYT